MTYSDIKEKLSKIAIQLLGCIDISDDCLYAIASNSSLAITFVTLIEEEFEIELLEEDVDISEPEWMLDEPGPSVDNLSEAITLNDKICFINDLFKGDSEQYYLSVQRLNEFAHFKEALEYTRRAFPHWDEESPEVYRFYMILRRRYDE